MQLEDRLHFAIPEPAWISISKTSSPGHQSNSPTIIYSSIHGQQSPSESNSRQSSKGENCKTRATILMRVAAAAPVNLGSLLKLQAISRPKFGGKNATIKNRISCSSSYSTVADMSGSGSDQGLSAPRLVVKKFLAEAQKEGDGATVRRSIGRPGLKYFDPFLLLDEFTVSAPAGFPDHPHRGFETVTYMFQGAFTHQDFAGHKGTIGTGDLQWMTAGRGIVHSEMPAAAGVNWGLQLWVNLASKDKMCKPRYQELPSSEITRAEKDGIEVRVIAGEGMGVKSPVFTRTPAMFLDFTLQPGASVSQPIPESYNAFVYTVEGEGIFGVPNSAPVPAHNCLVLGPGDGLSVWNNSSEPLRFVLIGGQPIGEPVVQYGPFVMNTQAEIQKAFEDYQHGKNGFEKARYWRSHSH